MTKNKCQRLRNQRLLKCECSIEKANTLKNGDVATFLVATIVRIAMMVMITVITIVRLLMVERLFQEHAD